jgi:nuclear receptor interaction protein
MLSKVGQLSSSFQQRLIIAGHPYEPTMAVSGIDHTIKIFSPDSRDQRNARKGIGVQSSDSGSFSSLNWGRRRRTHATDEDAQRPAEALSDSDEEVAMNGLRSRKRMHEAYQITSKNDMDRKGGREDYFISVSRLINNVITFADLL